MRAKGPQRSQWLLLIVEIGLGQQKVCLKNVCFALFLSASATAIEGETKCIEV
jgi:hypothetical protein